MKYSLLSILFFSFVFSSNAQEKSKISYNELGQKVETISPTKFAISLPTRDLPKASEDENSYEMEDRKRVPNFVQREREINLDDLVQNEDPIVQSQMGTRAAGEPLENWQALSGTGYPPDPSGAAGNDYYVQAVNTKYIVYDKEGNVEQSPANLSSLWTGSGNDGDPIVLYDKHADRWFISQFQYSTGNKILIAVSVSNDPTGEFYTYEYSLSSFPDYPKFSIWWDGYYMSMNASGSTSGVFDRQKMLDGDPSAEMIILNAPGVQSNGFRSMMPADADGELPANGSPAYFFNLEDDYWSGVTTDGIQVYKMTTDWDNTSNTSIVQENFIETADFNTQFGSGGWSWEHIEQQDSNQKLDAVNGVIMYRAAHRVWAGYNSIVMTHVVDVNGDDRAGVRWYELRQTGLNDWELYQQGTYAPSSDEESRWMSGIAMDDEGNIGMAYSISGPNANPGLRYTGRFASDPLGEMTIEESSAKEGLGAQSGIDRFGDYAHMSLDPNGYTFWFTGEYIGSSGDPRTRVFSFEISAANNIENGNPFYSDLETKILNQNNQFIFNVNGLYNNDELTFDIFDLQGKLVDHRIINPNSNSFSEIVNTAEFSSGNYLVRFGNVNFQIVEKINILN